MPGLGREARPSGSPPLTAFKSHQPWKDRQENLLLQALEVILRLFLWGILVDAEMRTELGPEDAQERGWRRCKPPQVLFVTKVGFAAPGMNYGKSGTVWAWGTTKKET